jgi:hypothetical protein
MIGILFWLLVGHALADYPLQGDWLSKAKNPTFDLVPGATIWPLALLFHALIHAGAVALVTGSMALAICELVAHAAIDYWKCRGGLTYNADQVAHVLCKVVWAAMATWPVA